MGWTTILASFSQTHLINLVNRTVVEHITIEYIVVKRIVVEHITIE
jgi:hypothetical protein